MVKLGLLARLEAKPGKEAELEAFLKSALPLAENETGTTVWFALKFGPSSFGIYDAFADEAFCRAVVAAMVARREIPMSTGKLQFRYQLTGRI